MAQTPTPFDDLDHSGQPVPLSKNTQSLPPRPGSLLGNLQSGRKLPIDNDDDTAPTSHAPVANAPVANAPVANAPVANAPAPTLPPIVPSAPIPSAPIPSAPVTPISTPPVVNGTAKLKLIPLPTLIGLAAAFGALAVVLSSTLMSRLLPTVPMKTLPVPTAPAPNNDVLMNAPAAPTETPQIEATTAPTAPEVSAVPEANTDNVAAPDTQASPTAPTEQPTPSPSPETSPTAPPNNPANEPISTHRGSRYEIAPPAGWKKLHGGRRTIWKGPQDAQLLVETTSKTDASPREDWEKLDRAFSKNYGSRYRSLGIRDTTLAGKPAAIWEFELTGKDGSVTRKMDVAVHHNGRGYAVLGAAPRDSFDQVRPQIESAINSFQLKAPKPEAPKRDDETRPRAQTLPDEPNNQTPARDNNNSESGY